ncbi:MAG: transcriptional repressor [Pseudomonadota bacterium]
MKDRGRRTQTAVLAMLRQQRGALSAYALLDAMRETNPTISAPTIYRALAALSERGEVQRLESLNAYIACKHGCEDQTSILSICDDCGLVEESAAPHLLEQLSKLAGRSGFATTRHVVEIHGRCASCDDAEGPA